MTKQETFDTVCRALIAQGRQSISDGECRYRAEDGILRCAAGVLIPDELYGSWMEGVSVPPELKEPEVEDEPGFPADREERIGWILRRAGHDLPLVAELQDAHDRSDPDPERFVESFKRWAWAVARDHGLSTEVFDG